LSDPAQVKATLIPYSAEYSATVRSWIDSGEIYSYVCRGKDFPPPDDVVDSWQRNDITSHVLLSNNKPVGYGELWDRRLERAVEIAHLIVDPHRRSEGLGTKLVQQLYDRAAARGSVTKVLVNLYSDNTIALGCYVKAGFELVSTASYTVGLRLVRLVQK